MADLQSHEGSWENPATGHALFYRLWGSPASPSLLVIVHGFGEHSGRYTTFAQALAERGLAVACADLVGHGRSTGRRGDIQQVTQYLEGLEAVTEARFLALTHPRRITIFGHSVGGLLAILWTLRHPQRCRSLVLQSPLLGVGYPVPAWKQRLAECFKFVWPTAAFPLGLDPAWLSHDPSIVQRYRRDPLVHHAITVRCYFALQDAMRQAHEQAASVRRPTLLLYGTDDRVVSVSMCRTFFARLTCEKRAVSFPGCYHELHHEPVASDVVEAVVDWVQRHA